MKILVVRFSSIGDIVLTTPILRGIKLQLENVELHYLTKKQFAVIPESNPYVDKVFTIVRKTSEIISDLKKEKYDYVIDLHTNFRSHQILASLKTNSFSFQKLNFKKWLFVNFKINKLPPIHIVDRYYNAVLKLGVKNDFLGLDYFIPAIDEINITSLPVSFQNGYNVLVLGGTYFTKQIPLNKLEEICSMSTVPIVLLGGMLEQPVAQVLENKFTSRLFNACGKYNLNQSASFIKQAHKVFTGDTGLMHIASAFKKHIISFWGNTIPEFGMYPYMANPKSRILEIKNLSCRPCSKLGHKKCPKKHFKCMNEIQILPEYFVD